MCVESNNNFPLSASDPALFFDLMVFSCGQVKWPIREPSVHTQQRQLTLEMEWKSGQFHQAHSFPSLYLFIM